MNMNHPKQSMEFSKNALGTSAEGQIGQIRQVVKLAYDLREFRKNSIGRVVEYIPFVIFDIHFQNQIRRDRPGMLRHEVGQRSSLRSCVDGYHLVMKMQERMLRRRPFD